MGKNCDIMGVIVKGCFYFEIMGSDVGTFVWSAVVLCRHTVDFTNSSLFNQVVK